MCIKRDKQWPVYGNPIIYVMFLVALNCKQLGPKKSL